MSITLVICAGAACWIITGTVLAYFYSEAPPKVSQRVLTFSQRVARQRAIEEVYWRHRIWPARNTKPKPSLAEMMSAAQIAKRVEDYLRDSQALETYWHKSITPDQLQAEMDRMARNTKQPEVLREIFAALGDDPFVIAECLARPILAERFVAEVLTQDRTGRRESLRSYLQQLNQVPAIDSISEAVQVNRPYQLPRIIAGASITCTDDRWTATNLTDVPAARYYHTAVWTGSEMIVWGGRDNTSLFNTGGRYDPSTDSWTATSTTGAPEAREFHSAVWTGSEMIVWGGDDLNNFLNTGGRYDPSTDSWTATSTTDAASGREAHTAVWDGSEMVVWGGYNRAFLNTGGRYDPSTDSWTATTTTGAPEARGSHSTVWTGSEMIVWGGSATINVYFNTGGRYNPTTDSWTTTSLTNVPTARTSYTAVWNGSEMIVWGGYNPAFLNTGGRYDPSTDSWTATTTANAPSPRYSHTGVWTSSEMIVWGGVDSGTDFGVNTGGRYNPTTDSWTATTNTNAPHGRYSHTAVWTGSQMIVWGGRYSSGTIQPLNTGGRYCAVAPSPTPTPTATPTPTSTPRTTPTPRPRPTPPPRP